MLMYLNTQDTQYSIISILAFYHGRIYFYFEEKNHRTYDGDDYIIILLQTIIQINVSIA